MHDLQEKILVGGLCDTPYSVPFAAASLLKDTVNRIGDLVDDGVPNSSFKG
jgi:hypothetical protein